MKENSVSNENFARYPFILWEIKSGKPHVLKAITGVPHAKDSTQVFGKLSTLDGITNASAELYKSCKLV